MIPPKHLEYFVTEWVAASLEAIVAHRLFPCIGSTSSARVNVLRPTQSFDGRWLPSRSNPNQSSRSVWDATPKEEEDNGAVSSQVPTGEGRSACQFSEGFTPESAFHFQVEIPQIETLRAALLSDANFNLHSSWQLGVIISLDITPEHVSTHGAQEVAGTSASSLKSHGARSAGMGEKGVKNVRDSSGGFLWYSDTLSDVQLFGNTGTGENLAHATESQTHCCLEQWVISFQPSTSPGQQTKFEHRKLCTTLKGLMAAIHFLPAHSALLALTNPEKCGDSRGGQKRNCFQKNNHVTTYICARWQGQQTKARHGRESPWTPLAFYRSDLEGSLACRSRETLRLGATNFWNSAEALGDPGAVQGLGAAHWQWMGSAKVDSETDALPPGSPLLTRRRSRRKQQGVPTPTFGGNGGFSLQGLSCRSSIAGYADAASSARVDASETRTLLCLTTSLGSLECTVTYNEDVAQSIVAARELDAISGCLEEFHPIAQHSYADQVDSTHDAVTVVSDSEPWLEMEDPYGSFDPLPPPLDFAFSDPAVTAGDRGCASGVPKRKWGIWHSLLQKTAVRRAYRFAALPVYRLGLGPLLDRYPSRGIMKLSGAADAANGNGKVEDCFGEQGLAWVPCSPSAASAGSPRGKSGCSTLPVCSVPISSVGEITTKNSQLCRGAHMEVFGPTSDELVPEEFGDGLKAEERELVEDSDFGAIWLNNATNFISFASGPSPTTSQETFQRQASGGKISLSVMQRITEALNSEDEGSALKSMHLLSESLRALERFVTQLFPTEDSVNNASCDINTWPLQEINDDADDTHLTLCPSEEGNDYLRIRARWRQVSNCAATIGAQQAEARALRELTSFELDPTVVTPMGLQSSFTKEGSMYSGHLHTVASYLLQPGPPLDPIFPPEPPPLQQYLNRLRAKQTDWLDDRECGENFQLETVDVSACKTSQVHESDPWCTQDIISALRSFEDVESSFLPLGFMGLP